MKYQNLVTNEELTSLLEQAASHLSIIEKREVAKDEVILRALDMYIPTILPVDIMQQLKYGKLSQYAGKYIEIIYSLAGCTVPALSRSTHVSSNTSTRDIVRDHVALDRGYIRHVYTEDGEKLVLFYPAQSSSHYAFLIPLSSIKTIRLLTNKPRITYTKICGKMDPKHLQILNKT